MFQDRYEVMSNFTVKIETRKSTSDSETPHGWQLYRTKTRENGKERELPLEQPEKQRKEVTIRSA